VAFTGQSLSGPADAVSLLTLSANAEDLLIRLGESARNVPADKRRAAGGRSQGLSCAQKIADDGPEGVIAGHAPHEFRRRK